MRRVLQPELLDELPSNDPRAIHSRKDLRRINAIMGNAREIARFVGKFARGQRVRSSISIAEIGAGEGYIAAHVADALSREGFSGNLLLVDKQSFEAPRIQQWNVAFVEADVFDWLRKSERVDVIIANLFLHHFDDGRLRELLTKCAIICNCFAAAEPRRSPFALWFGRRLTWIGCNDVTLHDAEISIRAGFNRSEVSEFWPRSAGWRLVEKRAGLFTHFFGATRRA